MKLFLAVLLVLVILDTVVIAVVLAKRLFKRITRDTIQEIQAQWKGIIRQSDYQHAIMDADKLLDFTLGKMGFQGSLAQKLRQGKRLFSDVNQVWGAHKVRNNIAHQINYKVDEASYKKSMFAFKQAFTDLKIF